MTQAEGRSALLRQEAIAAIVMNALMSIGFFFLVFGWNPVAARNLAFDFLPQSFGVTFLGTLIPSLITYRRLTSGKVAPAGPVPTKFRHLGRIALVSVGAVILFGGLAGLATIALAPVVLSPLPALVIKTIYGAALGRLMTPPIIRALLGMPMFGRDNPRLAEAAQ